MKTQEKVEQLLADLLTEGEAVLKTKWQQRGNWVSGPPSYVDLASFSTWRARCKLLASLFEQGMAQQIGECDLDPKHTLGREIGSHRGLAFGDGGVDPGRCVREPRGTS